MNYTRKFFILSLLLSVISFSASYAMQNMVQERNDLVQQARQMIDNNLINNDFLVLSSQWEELNEKENKNVSLFNKVLNCYRCEWCNLIPGLKFEDNNIYLFQNITRLVNFFIKHDLDIRKKDFLGTKPLKALEDLAEQFYSVYRFRNRDLDKKIDTFKQRISGKNLLACIKNEGFSYECKFLFSDVPIENPVEAIDFKANEFKNIRERGIQRGSLSVFTVAMFFLGEKILRKISRSRQGWKRYVELCIENRECDQFKKLWEGLGALIDEVKKHVGRISFNSNVTHILKTKKMSDVTINFQ